MADKTNSKKSNRVSIHITGMTCTTCAATVEKGLSQTPGVEQIDVNFTSEKASVEYLEGTRLYNSFMFQADIRIEQMWRLNMTALPKNYRA